MLPRKAAWDHTEVTNRGEERISRTEVLAVVRGEGGVGGAAAEGRVLPRLHHQAGLIDIPPRQPEVDDVPRACRIHREAWNRIVEGADDGQGPTGPRAEG